MKLKSVLTYHVVAGKFDSAAVLDAEDSNGNMALYEQKLL
jgi:uncharacterized surface protein with fasciclin (FAS1) repeats